MAEAAKLIFVYNADSGLFNTFADIGHKIFSPATYPCDLCQLTHGYFSERTSWRAFVERLPIECEFLHRDQFAAQFPDITEPLPAVFLAHADQLERCMSAAELAQCQRLEDLQTLLRQVVAGQASEEC